MAVGDLDDEGIGVPRAEQARPDSAWRCTPYPMVFVIIVSMRSSVSSLVVSASSSGRAAAPTTSWAVGSGSSSEQASFACAVAGSETVRGSRSSRSTGRATGASSAERGASSAGPEGAAGP